MDDFTLGVIRAKMALKLRYQKMKRLNLPQNY